MSDQTPRPLRQYLPVEVDLDDLMDDIMGDAAKHADDLISSTVGKKGLGATVDRVQLNAIKARMRKESDETWKSVGKTIAKKIPDAAAAAAKDLLLEDQARLRAIGIDSKVYRDSVLMQATDNVPTLIARGANNIPLADSVYGAKNLADGMVDRVINRNILLGRSAKQMADEVRNLIDPNVRGGVSYAAKRLGRTELNNAFHTTQVNLRRNTPWVVAMLWNLSGSHPKPDECNEYAETSHYTGGQPGAYRTNEVPQKPHPNCLCFMTSIENSEEEFINSFIDGEYDTYLDERIASLRIDYVKRGR